MRKIAAIFVVITLVLLMSQVVVLGAAKLVYPDGYTDPFVPYEAIMPGQPSDVFREYLYEYSCRFSNADSNTLDCLIDSGDGTFSSVIIQFYNHTIREVNFIADRLYVIELVGRWGYPTVIARHDDFFYLRWGSHVRAFVVLAQRFSYRLPVLSVAIRPAE